MDLCFGTADASVAFSEQEEVYRSAVSTGDILQGWNLRLVTYTGGWQSSERQTRTGLSEPGSLSHSQTLQANKPPLPTTLYTVKRTYILLHRTDSFGIGATQALSPGLSEVPSSLSSSWYYPAI